MVSAAGIRRRYSLPGGYIKTFVMCRIAVFRLPVGTGGAARRNFKPTSAIGGLAGDAMSGEKNIIKPVAASGKVAHNYGAEHKVCNFER